MTAPIKNPSASAQPVDQPVNRLRLLFERTEQRLLVGFIVISLIGLGVWAWRYSARVNQLIDIDRRVPQTAAFQIDLNQANWEEICNLPGIGERLAHDIVAYRQQHGPFPSQTAIQSVSGIGPQTYHRIAPFLAPIPSNPASMAPCPNAGKLVDSSPEQVAPDEE